MIVNIKEQYGLLSIEELEKLPTKRLLAYYRKKVLPVVGKVLGDWCAQYGVCEQCGDEVCMTWAAKVEKYQQQIKDILNTREHVE